MKLSNLPRYLLIAVLLGGVSPSAHAYLRLKNNSNQSVAWSDVSQRMRMSQVSFPQGSIWSDAFEEAIEQWLYNPSPFYFFTEYGEDSVDSDNSQNEVWFSDDNSLLDGSPAVTLSWFSGTSITAADIIYDVDFDFTVSDSASRSVAYTGTERPFIGTSIHELGHALGLDHEDDVYNQMGQSWTHVNRNGDTLKFHPGEDASNGAVAIYGVVSSGYQDVSVSHWKYLGNDGDGYSTHQRTKVYNSSGVALQVRAGTEDDDPAYEVTKGTTVKPEFTFENNGRSTQTPVVGWYLSTNNTISTADTFLDTTSPSLGRNNVYVTSNAVVLPSSLTSGTYYWLGVVIDKDDLIDEVREANNATHIRIYVK